MVPSAQSTTDTDALRQCFAAEGLRLLGVAAVDGPGDEDRSAARAAYRQWLAAGRHGSMTFLERHEPGKYDPHFALEGTRSVLVAGLSYAQIRPVAAEGRGLVARYAWGRDYHKVILEKLRKITRSLEERWPDERWRSFTDTAPLDERYWAAQAGASFTARNTLAIHHELGSWFLIGEVLTTRAFTPTGPRPGSQGSCPSACRRCLTACPTGALDHSGTIDARRCIAYLTIEHRGPIDDGLKAGIGPWVFGCDLCQEVCPLNLRVSPTTEPQFLAWKAGPDLNLDEVLELQGPRFTERFGGSPVHRAGRDGLVRNACLVAANTGRSELLPQLRRLAADPDPGVADAAQWAVAQLSQGGER